MKFAVRDDDTSHFTRPKDLIRAYDFLEEGCVSLSVVPYTVSVHKDDVFPYGEGIKYGFYDVADNPEIVEYLRKESASGKYDILLHGFSHEYKEVDGSWKAEMMWKSQQQLQEELTKGKEYFEALFGRTISVFVVPNNAINQNAISVLEESGMNYSGISQNFLKRWGYMAVKKNTYPGILDYGKHKEVITYTLDNYDGLVQEYQACKKRGQPFVVYTHYWQVNQNPVIKDLLRRITDYVLNDEAEMLSMSKCFEE